MEAAFPPGALWDMPGKLGHGSAGAHGGRGGRCALLARRGRDWGAEVRGRSSSPQCQGSGMPSRRSGLQASLERGGNIDSVKRRSGRVEGPGRSPLQAEGRAWADVSCAPDRAGSRFAWVSRGRKGEMRLGGGASWAHGGYARERGLHAEEHRERWSPPGADVHCRRLPKSAVRRVGGGKAEAKAQGTAKGLC